MKSKINPQLRSKKEAEVNEIENRYTQKKLMKQNLLFEKIQ